MNMLSQPPNKNLSQYGKESAAKELRSEDVYEELDLKKIFIKQPHEFFRRCMRD